MNKKLFIGLFSCISILSGCQTNSANRKVDPELTQTHSAQFFSKSSWQSCIVGAGFTGIGCFLIGGDSTECIIAATVGCGIAMGANYYLDTKRAEYANDEQRLDVYIQDLRKNTEEVKEISNVSQKVLTKNLATLKALNKQISDATIDKKHAKQELEQIDSNINYLVDKMSRMKEASSNWTAIAREEQRSGVNVAKLDQEIYQLNKQISALEQQINIVGQMRSSVRIS